MGRRVRELSAEPMGERDGKPEVLVTELAYEEGGTCYLSGAHAPRGYWVRVRPEQREEGSRVFQVFEGGKMFVQEAARFSEKTFGKITVSDEALKKFQSKVLATVLRERAEKAARR